MALSRAKKEEAVAEISQLLADSKLTVLAYYPGTSVKAMQELRTQAISGGTYIKVVKNRLFKRALESNERLQHIKVDELKGQLLYAFNSSDEVAPAQVLAAFARNNPQIEFAGAITSDGQLLTSDDVKALANLPTKEQLRAQLLGLISSPISGMVNVMAASVRSVMNVMNARADSLSN